MTDFLVELRLDPAFDAEQEESRRLLAAEREVALGLKTEGAVRGMWRLPQGGTVSIWSAASRSQLDSFLARLPLWSALDATIVELGPHYLGDGLSPAED